MTYEWQRLKKDGERVEKKGLRSISEVDAPGGPLNWMSETGFLPAKVPRHQNLQQASPLSFPIKHWGSIAVQADP